MKMPSLRNGKRLIAGLVFRNMGIETEDDDMDRETVGRKLVEELPPEMLKEFTEIFSFFDRYGFTFSISKYHELVERDGGGSIGAEELEQVLHHPQIFV